MKHVWTLFLSIFGIVSCSMPLGEPFHTVLDVPFATNNKTQYLESKNAPDLVVEPPLTTSNLSGFYRLPPPPKNPKSSVSPPIT
ncbi:MAG: hypothetical protein P1U32_05685 [Legionellaceae bacterium]|nr:hypothetical protein [Legionellaceae bacterium]